MSRIRLLKAHQTTFELIDENNQLSLPAALRNRYQQWNFFDFSFLFEIYNY